LDDGCGGGWGWLRSGIGRWWWSVVIVVGVGECGASGVGGEGI